MTEKEKLTAFGIVRRKTTKGGGGGDVIEMESLDPTGYLCLLSRCLLKSWASIGLQTARVGLVLSLSRRRANKRSGSHLQARRDERRVADAAASGVGPISAGPTPRR